MTPIMDRSSGRVIGWNVVLNINSVTKRQQFFTKLHSRLSLETRRARYAASYNGLFEKYRAQRDLIALHMQSVGEAYRVLEVGAGSGLLTSELVKVPRRVTAVDHNIHLLRQLRDRVALISRRVKVVKQNPDDLRSLPASRYEAAVMMNTLHKLEDPLTCLKKIFDSLIPGGSISVSFLTCGPAIDPLFKALRTDLESQNCYDQLQHQFTHVLEHERELAAALPYRILTRVDVRALLLEAGFALQTEVEGLFGGHALFLTARKPD
jgi:ubiquinone/menaquinone biosynthesis C-methylase UbiE